MRPLTITCWASLAGWIAGFLAGNILGFAMASPQWLQNTLKAWDLIALELWWAFAVAVAMSPGCVFLAALLATRPKDKPSRWRPIPAFWVGGASGIVGLFLWVAVLTRSNPFKDWTGPGERSFTAMIAAVAFLVGATAACRAASLTRSPDAPDAPPIHPDAAPAPEPDEY